MPPWSQSLTRKGRNKHGLDYSLQQMLRLLQLNLFERRDLLRLLRGEPDKPINTCLNQLPLAIS